MTRLTPPGRRLWRSTTDYPLVVAIILAIALVTLAVLPGATQAASGERLLVADLRGHALVVLDPRRPDAARRIALPGGPHELLSLPDGRVAVSLEQSGMVAVVDLDTEVVAVLATGGLPHGLALQRTAEGDRLRLLVTDRERGAVRRFAIDGPPSMWREADPVMAPGWPHAVVARADGAIAVARASDGMLSVAGREIAVSALPETIALSPDGRHLATAGATGGAVQILEWSGAVTVEAPIGGRPVRTVFSPDGSLVAAARSAASSVALVDQAGRVRTVAVVGTPDGLAFSPDGARLYAADMAGGRVTVVEVTTGRTLAVMAVGQSAGSLAAVGPAR